MKMKLLQQILDKMQPLLKNECNYSNIAKIKEDSIWDENTQQWILPNVTFNRIRLPPASQHQSSNHNSSSDRYIRQVTPSRLYRPDSPNVIFDSDIIDSQLSNHSPSSSGLDMNDVGYNNEDKLLRKLENSQSDDIVTNYLTPKRRQQLLNTLHKLKLSESLPLDHFQYHSN